jgi:DeoR/GlpR family transcriptional regulator of sugar metabolism
MIIRATRSGRIRIDDLADLTGVSAVTIRRDLHELAAEGLVQRVHGAATAPTRRGAPYPFDVRLDEHAELKQQMAAVVVRDVPDGTTLFIDNGTSALAVARALVGRSITALTTSLHAASVLASEPGPTVVVPGGVVEARTLELAGSAVVDAVRDMRFDVAVLGACAASPTDGLTTSTFADAQVKREALRHARQRILLASADKLIRTSAHRFAGVEDLTVLVTGEDAGPTLLDEYRAAGVEVHRVEVPPLRSTP